MNVFSLDTVPLYGDSFYFVNGANKNMTEIIKELFPQFKFFRIIGNPLIFLTFYLCSYSPLALSLITTSSVFILIFIYSRVFTAFIAQKTNGMDTLFGLLFLSLPFSFYIILNITTSNQIISILLLAGCLWLINGYAKRPSNTYAVYLAAFFYAVSLFTYEISLLMPFYFVILFLSLSSKDGVKYKPLLILCIATFSMLLIYLFSQYHFIESQPKLSNSIAIYDPYRYELTFWEQIIRKFLLLIYYIKWSYFFVGHSFGYLKRQDIILSVSYLCISGYALWKTLSDRAAFLKRQDAVFAATNGLAFFLCSFGLWSYYWFFRKAFVTPPLYTLLLPCLGTAFALVGILSMLSPWFLKNKILRAAIFTCIFAGIVVNLSLFLSSYLSVKISLNEAQNYAN